MISSLLILLLTYWHESSSMNIDGAVAAADARRVEQRAEALPTSGGPRGERERQGQSQGLRRQVHVQVSGSLSTFKLLTIVALS